MAKARELRAPITRNSFCRVMQTLSDLEKRATSHAGICRLRLGEPASVHKQLRQILSRHPEDGETYLRRKVDDRDGRKKVRVRPEFEMGNSDPFRLDQLIIVAQTYLSQFHTQRRIGLVYPHNGRRHFAYIYAQSDHLSDEPVL